MLKKVFDLTSKVSKKCLTFFFSFKVKLQNVLLTNNLNIPYIYTVLKIFITLYTAKEIYNLLHLTLLIYVNFNY